MEDNKHTMGEPSETVDIPTFSMDIPTFSIPLFIRKGMATSITLPVDITRGELRMVTRILVEIVECDQLVTEDSED